jgi:hypothetical protein
LDAPDENYGFGIIAVEGVFSVWVKQPEEKEEEKLQAEAGGGAGGEGWKWKRVKEEAAELLWTFRWFRARDEPLDFAGASPRWVLVRKGKTLVLRDLDTVEGKDSTHQEQVLTNSLYVEEWTLMSEMYREIDVFPLFL